MKEKETGGNSGGKWKRAVHGRNCIRMLSLSLSPQAVRAAGRVSELCSKLKKMAAGGVEGRGFASSRKAKPDLTVPVLHCP